MEPRLWNSTGGKVIMEQSYWKSNGGIKMVEK